MLNNVSDSCLKPVADFPHGLPPLPDGDGGNDDGGDGAWVAWLIVLVVLLVIALVVAYGYRQGWSFDVQKLIRVGTGGRSQTTPTPQFDTTGPISSSSRTSGLPLAASDSATPYTPPIVSNA